MPMSPSKLYDCYQLNLQVNLSEEDSCLYSRYGSTLFKIKKVNQPVCCCENGQTDCCDEDDGDIDASILNIEIDKCDCTKAVFSLYVKLCCLERGCGSEQCNSLENPLLESSKTPFNGAKFTITSGASGRDCNVVTFVVNPLPPKVSTSGVVDKCYKFDITRVPCRVVEHCGDNTTCNSTTNAPNENVDQCDVTRYLGGDTLVVTFPMTKESKCLVPDFNYAGNLLKNVNNSSATKVRVVSGGPLKFSVPALLTFDKNSCTVSLQIGTFVTKQPGSSGKTTVVTGYEHVYGQLGCALELSDYSVSNCDYDCGTGASSVLDLMQSEVLSNEEKARKLFQLLATSKKLEVMGVDKCTEKTFFSFQLCVDPFKNVCVDKCGKKVETVVLCGQSLNNQGFNHSYRVHSEGDEYSYEWLWRQQASAQ
jgi:hypothetical protein